MDIKVRMGLHTGQAVSAGNRYTGLAVHRAARIGAAGHGGQILVSQATQTLLEDEEEDLHGFLRDLGEQQLKDLDRPVRLYQAVADGLPTQFPPLRHEASLAQSAEAAIRPAPVWRRPVVLTAGIAALLCLVAAGAYIRTRDTSGGLSAVSPNHVGVINPETNEIVAEIPVGIRPGPVATGAGFLWVGNLDDRTLTKIDAGLRSAAGTISLQNQTPTGIAVGLGAVWVAHGLRGELSRVDPQFGRVTRSVAVGGTAFGSPNGSVAIGDRSVWVVFGDSTLARIDAAGRLLGRTLAGSQPAGVVVAGQSIWVTNSGDATVQRFNAETFRQAGSSTPTARSGSRARATMSSRASTLDRAPPASSPSGRDLRRSRVRRARSGSPTAMRGASLASTPTTNEVAETIQIGNTPSGIAAADGLLWVTVQAP